MRVKKGKTLLRTLSKQLLKILTNTLETSLLCFLVIKIQSITLIKFFYSPFV